MLQFVYGTVLTSFIAMLLAVPVAVGLALYITDVAPVRLRKPLAYIVDLFAAVPSVVYGFWGIFALLPALHPIADKLSSWLDGVPVIGAVFAGPFFGPSYFAAGIVLAIMVLPIVTAICREVFAVAPVAEKEARARARRDALGDAAHVGAQALERGHLRREPARPRARVRRDDRRDDADRQQRARDHARASSARAPRCRA